MIMDVLSSATCLGQIESVFGIGIVHDVRCDEKLADFNLWILRVGNRWEGAIHTDWVPCICFSNVDVSLLRRAVRLPPSIACSRSGSQRIPFGEVMVGFG